MNCALSMHSVSVTLSVCSICTYCERLIKWSKDDSSITERNAFVEHGNVMLFYQITKLTFTGRFCLFDNDPSVIMSSVLFGFRVF